MVRCGMSELVITPALGSPIPGAGVERMSAGIKDDLYVKALVMETDQVQLAFAVLDAIDIPRTYVEAIRARVEEMTGIPGDDVHVAATHAHTSGPTIRTTFVRAVDENYIQWVVKKAADAVALAHANRREAVVGFGLGREEDISFNRRFYMKDGTVRMNPGIGNPDIDRAEGPIDPDVAVIRIDDLDGRPIGVVTNFACHADVVGGLEYSGDFPGELSRTIKQVLGQNVVSLFFQGACGNINHIDVSGRFPYERSSHFKKMGRILASEAIRTREKTQANDAVDVKMKRAYVHVRFRGPSEEELASARQVLQAEQDYPRTEVILARQAVELAESKEESAQAEVTAIAFGPDTALVCLPAEQFVEFGLAIKKQSPFALTIVNELTNGSLSGYVCTPQAYDNGGYETRLRYYSRTQHETGDLLVQQAVELLKELKALYSASAE